MRQRSTKKEWTELLALKDESNLSIKGFCEEFGVAVHQFYYWRKKLREERKEVATVGFVKVELAEELKDSGLVIDLERMQLRLERGFDETALEQVFRAAGRGRC